jgi:hypothetical protein
MYLYLYILCLLLISCILGLLLYPEDDQILRNVGNILPD